MKILDIYVTKYRRDSLKFLIRWIPVCRTNNLIKITTGTVNQKRFTVFLCLKVKISYRKSAHKYKKVLNKTLSDETFLIIWRCFFVPLNKCGIKFYPYATLVLIQLVVKSRVVFCFLGLGCVVQRIFVFWLG